jgi:probable HAF family extracellular repeat protein
MTLFAVFAAPSQVLAQQSRYKLIDLGTLGGPHSYLNSGNDGSFSVALLNNRGMLAGWADTSAPDPFPAFCFNEDCQASHVFQWDGARTDLGALTEGMSSQANWISRSGLIAGVSENGDIDPLLPGFPQLRGVLWRNGRITDLGTLPTGGYESFANAVNSGGQVVGWALNTTPDFNSLAGPGFLPTQTRAFLWQSGTMRDLGTLGGPDALAQFINERSQVVGWSYTGDSPNTSCPSLFPLATDSFIWSKEKGMQDLGTLAGTCTLVTGLNNKGTVVGIYVDDAQIERGFLWDSGSIRDLGGSLGGDFASAEGINDQGVTFGWAYLAGNTVYHPAIWKGVGELTDLGVLVPNSCGFASAINSKTQIVGASLAGCNFDSNTSAFLWQDDQMIDLNALIAPGASLHLQWAQNINDRGEIAGSGLDADGNAHDFLLIPCAANSPFDCQEEIVAGTEAAQAPLTPRPQIANPSNSIRQMLRRRLGPVPHILTPKAGFASSSQTSAISDSSSQLDDLISSHECAEISASFTSNSDASTTTNSRPAVRCSLHHTLEARSVVSGCAVFQAWFR